MGKKERTQGERRNNTKHRKEQKMHKSNGTFKKLDKGCKPPDLSHFKKKVIRTLENKQSNRQKTINHLKAERKLELHHFLEEKQFEMPMQEEDEGRQISDAHHDSNKYHKLMKKLIESCDIILQILDARDPMSCICEKIERKICGMPDKKLILVLNKIDLVPMENAIAWSNRLRQRFPVVMFKSNSQNQSSNLSTFNLYRKSIAESSELAETLINSSKALGADQLVQLIKQLSRFQGKKRAVTVGLIGYPNVGKSSIINSLKRSKTCEVSSVPGSTKHLQEVKLDDQVHLMDCPGVIFEKELTKNQLILRNTLKGNSNLEEVVQAILERIPMHQIMDYYKIDEYRTTQQFLAKVCRAKGKLGKGGIPQMKQGQKLVVEDWNRGNLKYFTIPERRTEMMEQRQE